MRGLFSIRAGRPVRAGLSILAGLTLVLTGCLPDDQRTDSIDPAASGRAELSAETVAQIDSGNAAYRRGDFEAAVTAFGTATASAPDDPTGWFGLYMAHQSLGNTAAADSAIATARSLAPGASLIRLPADSGGGPQ
jgi:Tfp pilus assembly protein PilF